MLQTIRSRVADRLRSLPIPSSKSTDRHSSLRQLTGDSAVIRDEHCSSTWSPPVKYKPSEFAKSRELGRIDPNLYLSEINEDLYDVPLGHLGRVWFTLVFDSTVEQLQVIVHKARNLRSPNWQSLHISTGVMSSDLTALGLLTPMPSQDCRIRIYLDHAERKCQTTSIKKQTNNPNFEESFTFQLPQHELAGRTLRMDVLCIEKTRRIRLIGFISVPLMFLNVTASAASDNASASAAASGPQRISQDLRLCETAHTPGNILLMVSLTYFPSNDRLTVGLFECHNLPLKATGQPISVYAKVTVCQGIQGKALKTKRTELLDQRESFNESFTFSKIGDPNAFHIRIALIQPSFFDKTIAMIIIGNAMAAKGNGITHWATAIERPEATITECHELAIP